MVEKFSINRLFPPTRGYITYEGSMTEPGCQETVTWIVSNKPAYVTPQQLQVLTKCGLSNPSIFGFDIQGLIHS